MKSEGEFDAGDWPRRNAELLLAVAKDRDEKAFGGLFQYFAPRVKGYFLRLGTNGGLAEELMQEVMLIVWRRAQLFDPSKASVGTWIFTIARNRRIDALRREGRPQFDPDDPCLVPDPVGAESMLDQAQLARNLRSALSELPIEQAELVRRSFFHDQSHGSIADELRLSLGTVKSRLRLALAKLRIAMTELK